MFVLNFCSFCFQTRDDNLVIILFFLLGNVITDGDYHLCLGSDSNTLEVISLSVVGCSCSQSRFVTNSCMPDLFLWYYDLPEAYIFSTPYEIIYALLYFLSHFSKCNGRLKKVLDFIPIFETFKICKMAITYITKSIIYTYTHIPTPFSLNSAKEQSLKLSEGLLPVFLISYFFPKPSRNSSCACLEHGSLSCCCSFLYNRS